VRIELKNITKYYAYGQNVFSSLNLTVERGETVAVLGAEGAGKTTLLKIIAGAECINSGEVLLDGQPRDLKSGEVLMLFDDGGLFLRKTVFDNLAYPLKIRGVDKAEIAARVLRLADDLDMAALLDCKIRELTTAEKKRVSFARLFLRDFSIVLVDDFGAGLDAKERKNLFFDLAAYLTRCGKTVVYSTTDADEAALVSDKIVVLHNGEIHQMGTAGEIYDSPKSVWAAELIDPNFTFGDCVLDYTDGALTVDIDGVKLDVGHLKSRLLSENYIGKKVLFGAHPEDFQVQSGGILQDVQSVLGLSDGSYIIQFESGWRVKSHQKLAGAVGVVPNAQKLFLFDKTSEGTILNDAQRAENK